MHFYVAPKISFAIKNNSSILVSTKKWYSSIGTFTRKPRYLVISFIFHKWSF